MNLLDILLVVVCLLAAGHFKGRLDAIADEGIKNLDWDKKYNFNKPMFKHWWYFGLYTPRFPERFPFSTTMLVFITDSWHRNQLLMLRCFYLSIVILMPISLWDMLIWAFIVMPVIVGVAFETSYNNCRDKIVLIKKQTTRHTPTPDSVDITTHVTSIPEKQIEDEQHN